MATYSFVTVDVFTRQRFGGNPLGVFTDARGLSSEQMQLLARELNLSETTFILPPADPAHAARVRIFTPGSEMPFAGHPMVGTGWWLGQQGLAADGRLTLEVPAGPVVIEVSETGAVVTAPRPLTLGQTLSVETVAACLGLTPDDLVTTAHAPRVAGVGADFVFVEVTPQALARAAPDVSAFRRTAAQVPGLNVTLSIHLYVRQGQTLRTRMFAPLDGIFEDPATGSANAALAALLLSLDGAAHAAFEITQGVEMGRPSALSATAFQTPEGVRATIGGGCVPVLRGQAVL